jgi:hypothetical protein
MITLEKDGKRMVVATELQASVFVRSGYKRVEAPEAPKTPERNFATEEAQETAPIADPESETPVSDEEAPRRRRRRAK